MSQRRKLEPALGYDIATDRVWAMLQFPCGSLTTEECIEALRMKLPAFVRDIEGYLQALEHEKSGGSHTISFWNDDLRDLALEKDLKEARNGER